MPEYVPVFKPGEDVTSTASVATTGGQLVGVSGPGSVAPVTAAASPSWVGVATTDAAAGAKVGWTSGGVQELTCTTAVTAGDLVVPSGTAGQVASLAAVTTPTAADVTGTRAIVGVALTSASAGAKARIKMER